MPKPALPIAPSVKSLTARRSEEQDFIMRHDTADSSVWYIVEIGWLQAWKQFVMNGSDPPGAINNSRLIADSGSPKPGLLAVRDYRAVNSEVWAFWHARYAGGPVLRRSKIDLYSDQLPDPLKPATCDKVKRSGSAPMAGVASESGGQLFAALSTPPDRPVAGQVVLAEYGPSQQTGSVQLTGMGGWYLARIVKMHGNSCDVSWLRPSADQWGCKTTLRQYLCSTGADETLFWDDLSIASQIRIPAENIQPA
eukprot:TRINITY_DN14304_c0_g1_i2.p1 TRINITY_DN14304_c0_g1~~TRINITY_DN14304_c0_g1_i2.p1  ORF type:complete len:286 (+),score=28.18 TRINITY_DN14304_c0_g1_i2:104-859(+)